VHDGVLGKVLFVTGRPPLWRLFAIWMGIGVQSFGGGSATLFLMRREAVERHGWISDEEFSRYWGICQIVPGINLLGQTILLGWKVAGAMGVAVCLLGLLLPSVSITILITAIYTSIRDLPAVRSALHGVIPATIGLGLLLGYQMVKPVVTVSRKEGFGSLLFSLGLIAGSALLVGWFGMPAVGVLWGAGSLCALVMWWRQ